MQYKSIKEIIMQYKIQFRFLFSIVFSLSAILLLFGIFTIVPYSVQGQTSDEVNSPEVVEILEKHITAIGGREAWKSHKTVETETELEVGSLIIKTHRIEERETRRFYQKSIQSNGVITETGFDGKQAWRKAPHTRGYLPDNDPTAHAAKTPSQALTEYKENKVKFTRLPNENISGKEYIVLKNTITDSTGREIEIRRYFDLETFLLCRLTRDKVVTIIDDYRWVDGKMNSFSQTHTTPQGESKFKTISIKYNVPVDSSKFEFGSESTSQTAPANAVPADSKPKTEAMENSANFLSEAIRLETFETVWKTVNDTHWDKNFGGVDWKAVYHKYLPQAKATANSDEFHKVLSRMLQELKMSHYSITPVRNNSGSTSSKNDKKPGTIGLGLRWIESQLVVYDLKPDSSAYQSGIRKGFVINKINGKTIDEIYAEFVKKNENMLGREESRRVVAVSGQLAGQAETKVSLEVLNKENKSVSLDVIRKPLTVVSNAEFTSRRLDKNIGYIKFNVFLHDVLPKFQSAVSELKDTQALIIDLRGNAGGIIDIATSIANLLSPTEGSLGNSIFRYQTTKFSYTGTGEQAYKGKVIILVDEFSGSSSEVLAGGLQEEKRAVVIGTTTYGAVLASLQTLLPTGAGLIYAVSDFETPKGVRLEGRGVIPDIPAKQIRTEILAGRDAVLARAIVFIESLSRTNAT